MALFNGMMISHQELGRPMSHSHGSAGPWIDSTFEAKDVNLAYRLYKSSASIKAIPRYRDLGDFGQCWTPWVFLSKKDVVPFNISKESRSGCASTDDPRKPRHPETYSSAPELIWAHGFKICWRISSETSIRQPGFADLLPRQR